MDLLAEILLKGLNKLKLLGEKIYQLLKYAAKWAGIKAVEAADFTADIIRKILAKMLVTLKAIAAGSLQFAVRNINPVSIGMLGGMLLTSVNAL